MNEQEFQLKKYQSESDQDFVARLVLELLNLKKSSNSHLGAVNQEDKARHDEMVQHSLANLGQGEEAQKILEEIKRVIEEKDIDLSEVMQCLSQVDSSIQKGNSGVSKKLDDLLSDFPETNAILQEIAQSVKENKSNDVVFDSVIEAQKKNTSMLGELVSKLTKKESPKKISIAGPVELLKPSWWKELSFSWEPIKELLEKIKAHTFSVKVENQFKIDEKIFKNLPDNVAKSLANVLSESLPKIRISGGGGGSNPFTFGAGGAVKVEIAGGVGDEGGAQETTLQEILTQMQAVNANTDGLEIKADTINLNTDTLEELTAMLTKPSDVQLTEVVPVLRSILTAIANPSYVDKSANQLRAQITGTLTTITTLTTVTGLTNIDSYQGRLLIMNQNNSAWANVVRSRIS